MVVEKTPAKKKGKKEAVIPDSLIYETIDRRPFFRKNYRAILNGKKSVEEATFTGFFQQVILSYLLRICHTQIASAKFRFLPHLGSIPDARSEVVADLSIFSTQVLTPDKITRSYVNVPAQIYVLAGIKADLEDMTETGYIRLKTQKLLDFGAEKVIWILTKPRQVIVATPGGKWEMPDWNLDVELIDGQIFNIGNYLKKEGINPDTQ